MSPPPKSSSRRGYDLYERLAAVKYPTLALIKGFCMGGGMELAMACRYRVAVDDPGTRMGLPEVMLGILPAWGGVKRLPQLLGAPAAFDLMLSGKTVDAKKAKKLGLVDEAVPPRIMWNTAIGVLKALPEPRTLAFVPNLMTNGFLRGFVASQARKQVAKRARREHYPAPYAIIDLWQKYNGDVHKPIGHRIVFDAGAALAFNGEEPDPRSQSARKAHSTGQGHRLQGEACSRRRRGRHGRGHRSVVCVARHHGDVARPRRIEDRAGDQARSRHVQEASARRAPHS